LAALSGVFQLAQSLPQLEGEAHFSKAGCCRFECFTRLERPAAFALALPERNVGASEVWLVAVSREELEATGEFITRL